MSTILTTKKLSQQQHTLQHHTTTPKKSPKHQHFPKISKKFLCGHMAVSKRCPGGGGLKIDSCKSAISFRSCFTRVVRMFHNSCNSLITNAKMLYIKQHIFNVLSFRLKQGQMVYIAA